MNFVCQNCNFLNPHNTLEEIFWNQVLKGEGCWEWMGNLVTNGYGRVGCNNLFYSTHRLSYELAYGPIPDGMLVCHKCDNRKCVRPNHLFLGTTQDNVDDKMRKGRHVAGKHSVLTKEKVQAIISEYVPGEVTYATLGEKYGVSPSTIWKVIKGKSWRPSADRLSDEPILTPVDLAVETVNLTSADELLTSTHEVGSNLPSKVGY